MTFEGIEGSGKSTQAELFHQWLRGRGFDVILTREPGGTGLGERIRRVLLGEPRVDIAPVPELLLYLASRAQLVSEVVRPALEKGRVVVADRFSDSTYAYQGWGRGIDLEMLEAVNRFATGGIFPDITFILDLDTRQGLARASGRSRKASPDRIESEDLSFHERVRQGFLDLARREKRCHLIDGSEAVDYVQREVQRIFDEFLTRQKSS